MIPRGIPIAQIDADTELDSKLQKLARQLGGADYYAAFGAYMSVVLRAWGTATRATDPDLLDLIPQEALEPLVRVGLLDASGSIPEDVFERRIGAVLEARRKDADRKRTPRESVGVHRTPADSDESSSPLLSSSSSLELPTTPLLNHPARAREDDDPVTTYFTLTTRYPRGNALAWCKRLGDDYGFSPASAAMVAAWADDDDVRTFLSRVEDRLVAAGRAAELREKAEEKERLRAKRATRLAPVADPDPVKVAEVMGDIRKALGR